MMIFRILCGEWIEPLWDCMRAEEVVRHNILYYIHISREEFIILKFILHIYIYFMQEWSIYMLRHFPAYASHGKFHGFEFVLGLIAQ